MTFGLTIEKLLLVGVIAALLIGPSRLPLYAGSLAKVAHRLQRLSQAARSRISEELGPDAADVDWSQLDPRKYDPRRIIREALLEPPPMEQRARPGVDATSPPARREQSDTKEQSDIQAERQE